MSFLKVQNVSKKFRGLHALENLSFEVAAGQTIGLIGPNGSGKSTFFNVLMNILSKDGGRIIFDGSDITAKKPHEISRLGVRRSFQDARPLPQITVRENLDIALPYRVSPSLAAVFGRSRELYREQKMHFQKIQELLKRVGLQGKERALAKQLSYGQGKLLEILKIMAAEARLILLDEPFSGLFPEMIALISELIRALSAEGRTVLLVEHNMKLIAELCDGVIVLDAGKKIAAGTFAEVRRDRKVIESYFGK